MTTVTDTPSQPGPSRHVAARLDQLDLHAPNGDATLDAWVVLATTLINASQRSNHTEAKAAAKAALCRIQHVLDRLGAFDDLQAAAILQSVSLRWAELKRLGRIR